MSALDRFAYAVKDVASLAAPVRAAIEEELLPAEAVRQIIFAPPHDGAAGRRRVGGRLSWRPSPSWVLVLTETRLLVATLEAGVARPTVSATNLADMLRVELGEILLYAWLEWSWAAEGELRQERVYFNAVREDLFRQMLDAIRGDIIAQSGAPLLGRERDLASFKGLPFKFENLIPRELLFPGETAQAVVYQPLIWGHHLGLLPYKRAQATVVVLTPQHLLVAQDDLSQADRAYGLIARYCPRDRIARAELETSEHDLWLTVTLLWRGVEEKLSVLFELAAEPRLRALLRGLEVAPEVVLPRRG